MAASTSAQKPATLSVRKEAWKSLLISLATPLVLLIFFAAAPGWLNSRLHSAYDDSIVKDTTMTATDKADAHAFFASADFDAVSTGAYDSQYERLHTALVDDGTATQFTLLHSALAASIFLVILLLAVDVMLALLNRQAQKSSDKLIFNYRLGYRIACGAALVNVLLLVPLLAYGSFEFTTLLADEYYPKLLLVIVIGGIVALWGSVSILLKNVPLEFRESLSRALPPEEAPELWQLVRTAAERLQTAPPDHILAGMQMNFYVTELAVVHDHGRVSGRTLYVSYPLLKQLSEDEVLAIIGHELGHFIGKDTALTREFYPLQLKVQSTMHVLAKSGWIGWPSLELLKYFTWIFQNTARTASRDRELLADAKGANLTSPHVMARALIKFQLAVEVFQRAMLAARRDSGNPLDFDLKTAVQQSLGADATFWSNLFEQRLPHPMDTHPTLHVRLESLGQVMTPEEARAVALEEAPAPVGWIQERAALFTELSTQTEQVFDKMRAQNEVASADFATAEGRALLEQHFPEIVWKRKPNSRVMFYVLMSLLILGCGLGAVFIDDTIFRLIMAALVALFGFGTFATWKRHHGAKFILNAEGIFYTTWKEPIRFKDMATITAANNSGRLSLNFVFNERRASPYQFNPISYPKKSLTFPISYLQVNSNLAAQTIFRYFTRQLE